MEPSEPSLFRLKELVKIIPPLLRVLPEEEFIRKHSPEKWSKKEILGHLIDSASNNHNRLLRIQYENEPVIAYDRDQWNRLSYHQELDTGHLINLWTALNFHLYEIASRIPGKDLQRAGLLANGQKYPLYWYISDYIRHLEHHLRQIVKYE
jgi:hypothetical protein